MPSPPRGPPCRGALRRGYKNQAQMGLNMIDTEVIRLRRLRHPDLRGRAIAAALDSDPAGRGSVFSASAQICWRIARVVTGRLRAHPYLSYQRGPSELRAVSHHVSATILGAIARYRGR